MRCPVCRRDIDTRELAEQTVLIGHYRDGRAAPCEGSHKPVPVEFLRPRTLFDE